MEGSDKKEGNSGEKEDIIRVRGRRLLGEESDWQGHSNKKKEEERDEK